MGISKEQMYAIVGLLLFLQGAAAYGTQDPNYCYSVDTDIDGYGITGYWGSNKVRTHSYVTSVQDCQQNCVRNGLCKAFVWNSEDRTCDLMKDMKKLEFDSKRRKWVGMKGCLGCERNGWDYGSDIQDVLYVDSHEKCSQICFYSELCKASSYSLGASACYLINNDSERMMGSAPRWITTKKDGTLFTGKKFIVTKYSNIITKYGGGKYIPGIRKPFHCKDICLLINGCKYWTHNDREYSSKMHSTCAYAASPDKLKFKQERYQTGGPRECREDTIYTNDDYPSY